MKKQSLVLLLILFLAFQNVAAQTAHKILILSFNPELYLSDAEQDIIFHNKKTPEVYRQFFRSSLDLKILGEVKSIAPAYSLMQDTSKGAREELNLFYAQCGYKYENPIGASKNKEKDEKKKSALFKKKEEEVPGFITTRGDAKFMNAEISDTAFYSYLMAQYDTDLALSINQFEIKTNYNSCIDIANKIYRRELIIHYTVFNRSAKIVAGNYAVAYFPSNSNKDTEIAELTFSEIAKEIADHVSVMIQ
jgi:hypothetical protein